ncbi:unnamed protein product, partial [marine sediment metagenome]
LDCAGTLRKSHEALRAKVEDYEKRGMRKLDGYGVVSISHTVCLKRRQMIALLVPVVEDPSAEAKEEE